MKADDSYYTAPEDESLNKDDQSIVVYVIVDFMSCSVITVYEKLTPFAI